MVPAIMASLHGPMAASLLAGPVMTGVGGVLLATGVALLATTRSGKDDADGGARVMSHVYGGLLAGGIGFGVASVGAAIWSTQCFD